MKIWKIFILLKSFGIKYYWLLFVFFVNLGLTTMCTVVIRSGWVICKEKGSDFLCDTVDNYAKFIVSLINLKASLKSKVSNKTGHNKMLVHLLMIRIYYDYPFGEPMYVLILKGRLILPSFIVLNALLHGETEFVRYKDILIFGSAIV